MRDSETKKIKIIRAFLAANLNANSGIFEIDARCARLNGGAGLARVSAV